MLFYKKYLLLVFLSFSLFSKAQELPQRIKVFTNTYIRLKERQQLDSIALLIAKYENLTDLKPLESQIIFHYMAMNYNFRGRYEDAIPIALRSLAYKTNNIISKQYTTYTYALLSDLNFTVKNYNQAKKYAKLALKAKVTEKNSTAFVNLHNILGYCYYLEEKYELSLKEYQIAKRRALKDKFCKIPEINCKIARIYGRQGKILDAKKMIYNGIKISDFCGEKITKLNSLKALREIYSENKQFENASKLIKIIDDLEGDKKIIIRNENIDSLETAFNTKFKVAQNEKLKFINKQKSKEINFQKIVLASFFLGLLLLLLLLFLVYKLSQKQKAINTIMLKQQEEIERSNHDLERLNLLNHKIFTVISHDFKGPMLTLELLLKTDLDKNLNQNTFQNNKEKIINHLFQANLVMQNLLNWAKTELKIVQQESQDNIVFETAEKTIYQLQSLLDEKKLTVFNIVPQDLKTNLQEDILIIIFRNLINNAIKFSFEENDIIIGFVAKTNEYFVQDFGIGMTTATIDSINNHNIIPKMGTNHETGFGLGLNFVISFLKQNQSSFRIESTYNEGSTFYFSLSNGLES